MTNRVNRNWLLANLSEPDVRVVDCRFELGAPLAGQHAYLADHIPGAVYLDLETDLSGPVQAHGGRHPIKDVALLADVLGKAGIDQKTTVVAYDDQGGMMAARLWWLLRYLGHSQVYLLEGGYRAWKEGGYPISNEVEVPDPSHFEYKVKSQMLADMQSVRLAMETGAAVLVDSRASARYAGDEEPLDKKAGHIPSAVNYCWNSVFLSDGKWKRREELEAHYAGIAKDAAIIVYCGSGVSACPNVIGLEEAGYTNVRLYAGSWSDWISYEENPVEVGNGRRC